MPKACSSIRRLVENQNHPFKSPISQASSWPSPLHSKHWIFLGEAIIIITLATGCSLSLFMILHLSRGKHTHGIRCGWLMWMVEAMICVDMDKTQNRPTLSDILKDVRSPELFSRHPSFENWRGPGHTEQLERTQQLRRGEWYGKLLSRSPAMCCSVISVIACCFLLPRAFRKDHPGSAGG